MFSPHQQTEQPALKRTPPSASWQLANVPAKNCLNELPFNFWDKLQINPIKILIQQRSLSLIALSVTAWSVENCFNRWFKFPSPSWEYNNLCIVRVNGAKRSLDQPALIAKLDLVAVRTKRQSAVLEIYARNTITTARERKRERQRYDIDRSRSLAIICHHILPSL